MLLLLLLEVVVVGSSWRENINNVPSETEKILKRSRVKDFEIIVSWLVGSLRYDTSQPMS